MEALNEPLLEPANGASRDADGAAPVRLEWAGVGVVAAATLAYAYQQQVEKIAAAATGPPKETTPLAQPLKSGP